MCKKKSKKTNETKEVTFIHTAELTSIFKVGDDESIRDTEEQKYMLEKFLKEKLGVDDVTVTNVQVFEREITNED